MHKNSKTFADRYVFLLDGMILVCKQQKRNSTLTNSEKFSLREKFHIRKVDVVDAKEDLDESELKFVIVNRDRDRDRENKTTFKAETPEDKRSWMAALVMLNTKSMLERTLGMVLKKIFFFCHRHIKQKFHQNFLDFS